MKYHMIIHAFKKHVECLNISRVQNKAKQAVFHHTNKQLLLNTTVGSHCSLKALCVYFTFMCMRCPLFTSSVIKSECLTGVK